MKTDISHLKEQARQVDIVSLAEKRTVLRKESGNSLCGPCPKCGGDDRFYIRTDRNKFYCRGCCNSGGDPITFICWLKGREPKGRDFIEAVEYLTNSKIEIGNGRINNYRRIQVEKKNEKEIRRPDKKWGGRAALISNRAREVLWTDAGKPGRDYLYGRGLTDDTIRHFELGYIPRDVFDKAENWGLSGDKDVYLPKGIAIPWWYFGDLARLNIRRIGDLGDGPKYIGPRGWAGTQPVFNVDSIDKGNVVIVVEGEMDAMLLWKAIGEKVVPVAIGSAKSCRSDVWVETFKICEIVIVALDSDEAGDSASNWWIDRLPNAVRLSPDGGKDVGEMVKAGIDLETWLRRILQDFSLDSTKNEPQLQPEQTSEPQPALPQLTQQKPEQPKPARPPQQNKPQHPVIEHIISHARLKTASIQLTITYTEQHLKEMSVVAEEMKQSAQDWLYCDWLAFIFDNGDERLQSTCLAELKNMIMCRPRDMYFQRNYRQLVGDNMKSLDKLYWQYAAEMFDWYMKGIKPTAVQQNKKSVALLTGQDIGYE